MAVEERGNPAGGWRSRSNEQRKGIVGFLLRAVWVARLSFKGLKTDAGRIDKRTFSPCGIRGFHRHSVEARPLERSGTCGANPLSRCLESRPAAASIKTDRHREDFSCPTSVLCFHSRRLPSSVLRSIDICVRIFH